MTATICSHPGCREPHDNWPGPGRDDLLCQGHWEAYSGQMWWQVVRPLDWLATVGQMHTLEAQS